ncbi:MAG TPA: CsgG/HfaB family protein [Bacteroidales bacterium]|nr:CsgG/HfaB family protein [Bacteroidales bacterium]
MKKKIILCLAASLIVVGSFAQKKKVVQTESQVQEIKDEGKSLKRKVAIARFSNETQYAKGLFYDKENDPIVKQASDILSTKLASSNKFILLERQDFDKIAEEVKLNNNENVQKIGADYLIIGSVTEFGRKNTGDVKVFSRSKTQVVQAGVSIRLVDVSTGMIIYSEEGKGEAETTSKTVMGMGESADYDATLSDKAISAAIAKLVDNIINNCMNRPWRAYFLSHDENGIIISGGKSQGLKVGDTFAVFQKGKSVKNPQTGMTIELPGKKVGKVKIDFVGGDNPTSEFSMVSFQEGSINAQSLMDYYIEEEK